ncbi:MAG: cation:proton antiporter [Patescibacteria group bacterium]|nr:cation:proton antiporter [Patescibacteria group bacterium]
MSHFSLLADLIVILITALAFGITAKKFRQPPITGYIIGGVATGLLLGKYLGGEISQLADIGVAILMFTLGLEFSFRHLARAIKVAVLGGALQIILCAAVFFLVLNFLSLGFYPSLFLALAFSLSSTAICVKILTERGETDTVYGEILVGILLVQDLAIVPMMVFLPYLNQILTVGGGGLLGKIWLLIISLFKSGLVLYLIFLLGKRSVPYVLNKAALLKSRELFLVTVILLVFSLAAVTFWSGLSFAAGAFLAGLLISETSQNHAVFAEIRPLRDLLSIMFFVILGMLFPASYLFLHFNLVLILGLLVMVLKFGLVIFLIFYFGYHLKTALMVGTGLAGVGEFAFVLARFGLSNKLLTLESYDLLLAVTLATMLITPTSMSLSEPVYRFLKQSAQKYSPALYERWFLRIDRKKTEEKELDLFNHVVICGHGRVGKHISRILTLANKPFIVVDFNLKVVSDLKKLGQPVLFGDPSDYEVLCYARVSMAKAIVIATPDRHSQEMIIQNSLSLNRNIVIICRSHFEEDKDRLYALGAHSIVQPEFEAGLYMGGQLLKIFGFSAEEIGEYLRRVRKEG